MNTPNPQPLRATFLGTADGHTSATRDHSGILLQAGEIHLLLDCGAAAARFLLGQDIPPDAPDAIWLSHMHSDHNGQVATLIQSLWLRQRRAPLHFFGPPEVMRAMKDWLERCLLFPELIGFPIVWHPVEPGHPVVHGPFTLTAFATNHLAALAENFRDRYPATCFECYGVTFEYAGRRHVYSADLARPDELVAALQAAPTASLICELTHFPERDLFQEVARYPVDSIWLTHYSDRLVGGEKNLQAVAREEGYSGQVHLMQDRVAQEI